LENGRKKKIWTLTSRFKAVFLTNGSMSWRPLFPTKESSPDLLITLLKLLPFLSLNPLINQSKIPTFPANPTSKSKTLEAKTYFFTLFLNP